VDVSSAIIHSTSGKTFSMALPARLVLNSTQVLSGRKVNPFNEKSLISQPTVRGTRPSYDWPHEIVAPYDGGRENTIITIDI